MGVCGVVVSDGSVTHMRANRRVLGDAGAGEFGLCADEEGSPKKRALDHGRVDESTAALTEYILRQVRA